MDEQGLKILIVDDEPNIRAGLCTGQKGEASLVEEAADAEGGLAKLQKSGREIVITDPRLPGLIG